VNAKNFTVCLGILAVAAALSAALYLTGVFEKKEKP
jgi:hypothetical protein